MVYTLTGAVTDYVADLLDFVITDPSNPYSLHLVNLEKVTSITGYAISKLILIRDLLDIDGEKIGLTLGSPTHPLLHQLAFGLFNKQVYIYPTQQKAEEVLLRSLVAKV